MKLFPPLGDLKGTLQVCDYRSRAPRHDTSDDKLTEVYLWGRNGELGVPRGGGNPTPQHQNCLPSPLNKEEQVLVDLSSTQYFPFSFPELSLGPIPPHGRHKKVLERPSSASGSDPGRDKGAPGLESPILTRQSLGLFRLIGRVVKTGFSLRQGKLTAKTSLQKKCLPKVLLRKWLGSVRQSDPPWHHLTENRSSQCGNWQLLLLLLLLLLSPSTFTAKQHYHLQLLCFVAYYIICQALNSALNRYPLIFYSKQPHEMLLIPFTDEAPEA